jgi:hypothetical protein
VTPLGGIDGEREIGGGKVPVVQGLGPHCGLQHRSVGISGEVDLQTGAA